MIRTTEQIAQDLLTDHQVRTKMLGKLGRLAEPSWLILLRIYAANPSKKATVHYVTSDLNYGYATMHRYLARLEKEHFITSHANRFDKRLQVLKLTPSTEFAIEQLLRRTAMRDAQ